MTDEIINQLTGLPPSLLHLFFFAAALIENVFPPWPGDTFIVFAGFLSAHDVIGFTEALVSTGLGSVAGALIMYFAGEKILRFARSVHDRLGEGWFRRFLTDIISEKQMQKTEDWFSRWGAGLVLVSRFSAGVRFFVNVVAGIANMNLSLFVVCYSAGALVWNLLLLGGGRILAENWRQLLDWLQYYNIAVIAVIGILVGFFLFVRWRRRQSGV